MSETGSKKTYTLDEIIEENVNSDQIEEHPKETTTQAEAAARGIAKGVTFGFADRITAALEWAVTGGGKSYDQALEESRKNYETTEKEWPKTTFGSELVGGAASTLIPGVGAVGRTAQAANAAKALKAAVAIGDTVAANAAKSILTKELIRGGAQSGALAGLGNSKDFNDLKGTAVSVGTGAALGGTLGYVVPETIEKAAKTKIGQAIGKSATKAGEIIKERLKPKRWQIPEFKTQPEKQARVDQIVKQGQDSGLTDRQILNTIATEFKDIPIESLEDAFKEKGIVGKIKQTVAGSQEAAEFIDRPEQLDRAERIKSGQTVEMARLEEGIRQAEQELQNISQQKQGWKGVAKSNLYTLKYEMQDLVNKYNDDRYINEKNQIGEQILALKERMRITSKLAESKNKLKTLKDINKKNANSVAAELQKLEKTQSAEQLQNVANLRDNLNNQVEQLATQRSNLVDQLDTIPAIDDADIGTFNDIMRQVKDKVEEKGMGDYWSLFTNEAFSGDPRINKVNAYIKYLSDRSNYTKELSKFQQGLIDVPPVAPEVVPVPTKGDVVGALITANQKISSASYGTPIAKVKRNLAEIIQENMKAISPEAYYIQRQLGETRAHVTVIEKSPFFEANYVPQKGPTGRVAPVSRKFIKTELPDISKKSSGYKEELKKIGIDIESIENAINTGKRAAIFESPQALESTVISDINQEITQQQKNLRQLSASESETQLRNRLADIELAKEKRRLSEYVRRRMEQERVNVGKILKDLDEQGISVEEYLAHLRNKKNTLSETESQLYSSLRQIEGIPASVRDVGQAAVISSKGQIPFSIGKILLPSPKTKIQLFNKIKNRFANPALTAAIRAAIERPITMETVRSLAMTHKVSEPELIKQFEDSGIEILMEEDIGLKAKELPTELEGKSIKSRIEKDKYGNIIINYNDPNIEDEYFTPEQWIELIDPFNELELKK